MPEKNMFGYIYETTNLINGKKYIGKHKSSKFDNKYYGSGIGINNALNKYGKENFKVIILEEVHTNQKDLDLRETYWIEYYNAVKDKNYYNRSYGGENEGWAGFNRAVKENLIKHPMKGRPSPNRGKLLSEEVKTKISIANKGKSRTIEQKSYISKRTKEAMKNQDTILKLIESHRNRRVSDETRKKMSLTWKEKCMDPKEKERRSAITSGELNGMYGKYHSNETKKKISEKAKNRFKENPESNGMYGKHHSDETRKKISEKAKDRYKNMKWINNGVINKRVNQDSLEEYLQQGYFLGRTK